MFMLLLHLHEQPLMPSQAAYSSSPPRSPHNRKNGTYVYPPPSGMRTRAFPSDMTALQI